MSEDRKKMSPTVAIRNYLGMRPGQTLAEFVAEMKQLSEAERIELARLCCIELGAELETKSTASAPVVPISISPAQ